MHSPTWGPFQVVLQYLSLQDVGLLLQDMDELSRVSRRRLLLVQVPVVLYFFVQELQYVILAQKRNGIVLCSLMKTFSFLT